MAYKKKSEETERPQKSGQLNSIRMLFYTFSRLGFHTYLTHVSASIGFLDIFYVKNEIFVVAMR